MKTFARLLAVVAVSSFAGSLVVAQEAGRGGPDRGGPGRMGPGGPQGGPVAFNAANPNGQQVCAAPAGTAAGQSACAMSGNPGALFAASMIQQFDADGDLTLNQTELQACLELLYAQAQAEIARAAQGTASQISAQMAANGGGSPFAIAANPMANCNSQSVTNQPQNSQSASNQLTRSARAGGPAGASQLRASGARGGGPRGGGR